ncbi:MAG: LysR family transcriptional regulator [Burkholderiaceae bacterium]|nr:LysR family transcriptional regulator [Burkholderiaceae bacterium]
MEFDGRMLNNVNVLAAVVAGGSFARAADTLGLTPSGVSRAVQRLEQRVGVRLFSRTTRSLALTDEGRRLYEEIGPLLAGIDEALTATAGTAAAVGGRLRVNVDPFFSGTMLAPRIAEFLQRHPALTLELVPREQLGDLVGEGFDLALRFGEPPISSLVVRKLLDTSTVTLAAPSYLKKHGVPHSPLDLAGHQCIMMRSPMTGEPIAWHYRQGRKSVTPPTAGSLIVGDAGTLVASCVGGAGIARVKAAGVRDLLEHGRLVQLFSDWEGERFALHALYPSRHLPPAKVRAFLDFVDEILRDYR